jgi:hypothetical protein
MDDADFTDEEGRADFGAFMQVAAFLTTDYTVI